LNYKSLDYKSVNIDLNKRQNQTAGYLQINRHGLVPTLIHDKHTIKEAQLINEYLDRVFPDIALLPKNPSMLYQVQYLCKRQEYINEYCLRYLSYQYSGRINTLTEDEIQTHPQLDRRIFLRNIKEGLSAASVYEIENYLINELKHLEEILS